LVGTSDPRCQEIAPDSIPNGDEPAGTSGECSFDADDRRPADR
jgi:hypothetical protein